MQSLFEEKAPIAILIATNEEFAAFLRMARQKVEMIAEIQKSAIKAQSFGAEMIKSEPPIDQIYQMRVGRQEVIVVHTAETIRRATRAVDYVAWAHGAKLIINFGTAGALKPEIGKSGIYLAEKVVQADFDISGGVTKRMAKKLGQPYIMPGQHNGYDEPYVYTNAKLREWVKECAPEVQEVAVASGNKFVFGKDKAEILEKFDADIVDMEAAGVLLTANEEKIPTLIFKCISDGVDAEAAEYYENASSVSEACSAFVIDLIEKM